MSPRRVAVLTMVASVLGIAAFAVAGCGDDSSSLPDGTVARVGDATISEAQLDAMIARTRQQAQAQGQTLPAEGAEGYDQVRQAALQTLIQGKIIDFEARKCGDDCEVTQADVQKEVLRLRRTNFNGSQKQFDAFLKQRGLTKQDANELLKQDLQLRALKAKVTRGVRFTEADAKKYYEDNPSQFTTPAGRTVRHILVPTKAEADRIRAEITPENFAELAKKYSTDKGSGQNGGDIGTLTKGSFVPEFEKVAFALKDGQISDPVKTVYGWHLIEVETTPKHTTSFAEAEPGILSAQLAAAREKEFNAWSAKVLTEWRDRTDYASDDLKPPETTSAPTATEPAP
jgi:foldase protein PrsA